MIPKKFEFILIQGSAGASFALRYEDEELRYLCMPPDHHDQGFGLDRIHKYAPTEGEQRDLKVSADQWQIFYDRLEPIGVWDWEPHYDDPDALQGVQWSFHFVFGDKEIRCGGTNAYPGEFKIGYSKEFRELLVEVNKLLSGLEFGCL